MKDKMSRVRGIVGFFLGGISAAIVNGVVFVAIFPPEGVPKQQALRLGIFAGIVQISFFVGGAIGWTGIKGQAISALAKPVIWSFVIITALALWNQALPNLFLILAFTTSGVLVSASLSTWASRYFLKPEA